MSDNNQEALPQFMGKGFVPQPPPIPPQQTYAQSPQASLAFEAWRIRQMLGLPQHAPSEAVFEALTRALRATGNQRKAVNHLIDALKIVSE